MSVVPRTVLFSSSCVHLYIIVVVYTAFLPEAQKLNIDQVFRVFVEDFSSCCCCSLLLYVVDDGRWVKDGLSPSLHLLCVCE